VLHRLLVFSGGLFATNRTENQQILNQDIASVVARMISLGSSTLADLSPGYKKKITHGCVSIYCCTTTSDRYPLSETEIIMKSLVL